MNLDTSYDAIRHSQELRLYIFFFLRVKLNHLNIVKKRISHKHARPMREKVKFAIGIAAISQLTRFSIEYTIYIIRINCPTAVP